MSVQTSLAEIKARVDQLAAHVTTEGAATYANAVASATALNTAGSATAGQMRTLDGLLDTLSRYVRREGQVILGNARAVLDSLRGPDATDDQKAGVVLSPAPARRGRAAWSMGAPNDIQYAGASGRTYQLVLDVPPDTVGIQLVLANSQAAAIDATAAALKYSFAPTEVAARSLGPVQGGAVVANAFTAVTWNGGSANVGSIPAATTGGGTVSAASGVLISDVMQLNTIARTDDPTGRRLVMIRATSGAGGWPYKSLGAGNYNGAFAAVAGGRVVIAGDCGAGDFTAANNPGAVTQTDIIPFFGVVFHTASASYMILCAGDSVMGGTGSAQADAYPQKFGELLRAAGKPVEIFNIGRAGSASSGFIGRAKNLIAAGLQPTHCMLPIHTQNDAGNTTPTAAQAKARVLEAVKFVQWLNERGIEPIIIGPTPLTANVQAFRDAVPIWEDAGAKLAASFGGVYVSPMSVTGTPGMEWLPTYGYDNPHPSDAANVAIADLLYRSTVARF